MPKRKAEDEEEVDDYSPPGKRQQTGKKPIMVVLPGSSSKLSKDMKEHLIPALEEAGFDVRVRPGKDEGQPSWSGWDPKKNATNVVRDLCPQQDDAAPWYVLGCSFGNRVATSIVSDELTKVAPGLILTGYPMYGPGENNKEARVEHIKKLPATAKVLAISGENDETIKKNAPAGSKTGRELWDEVIASMKCDVDLKLVPQAGHGTLPSGGSKKAQARTADAVANIVEWIGEFTGNSAGEDAFSFK